MKAMSRSRLLHGLSPGECAFDRCIVWFFFALGLTQVVNFLSWLSWRHVRHTHSAEGLPSIAAPAWEIWIPFVFGLLLAVYWAWALRGVVRSWSDPVACILRFSSAVLLLAQLFVIWSLLSVPWLHLLNPSAGE